jgi:hypothetical protein
MDISDIGIALGLFALICVCLPCRYDPAIRLKEWLERGHEKSRGGLGPGSP